MPTTEERAFVNPPEFPGRCLIIFLELCQPIIAIFTQGLHKREPLSNHQNFLEVLSNHFLGAVPIKQLQFSDKVCTKEANCNELAKNIFKDSLPEMLIFEERLVNILLIQKD